MRQTVSKTRFPFRTSLPVVWFILLVSFSCALAQQYAKGPVYGRIGFDNGSPAAGVKVRAFDYDGQGDLNKNDFIGETITDANGNYTIRIEGKHWDTDTLVSESWRPDVFITVLRNAGEWVKVAQSKVFDNKMHAQSLRIDMTIPSDRWVTKATQFRPDVHGWKFENLKSRVCWPSNNICNDWSFCGGMSLSALTKFRQGQPIPPETSPSQNTLKELKDSQLATMTDGVWKKFVEFTQSPTHPTAIAFHTIGHKTEQEVPALRKAIDSGAPIILGLIRVQQDNLAGGAFNNHQVLAIGYRFNEATGQMEIDIYDPNHPGTVSQISLQTRAPDNQIFAKQSTMEKVRGFFVIPMGSGPPTAGVPVSPGQRQRPISVRPR